MNDAKISAQVHRFRNHVTISLADGGTIYISPKDAQTLAYALNECAYDIVNIPNFSESQCGSREFEFDGKR